MATSNRFVSVLIDIVSALLRSARSTPQNDPQTQSPRARVRTDQTADAESEPGREAGTATVRIDPAGIRDLKITYAPDRDGAPDAGEVIWTWVPYEENDGRGKDRPVLVIGRQSAERVYAVRMTSKDHDGERDFLSIGSGSWDGQGRESWVDIEQLYSVHEKGLRREAAILDTTRFTKVAQALRTRYGWQSA